MTRAPDTKCLRIRHQQWGYPAANRLALVLMLSSIAACSIADDDRCGAGYVYHKPGCFPVADGSAEGLLPDGTDDDSGGEQTCMQISLCKQACTDATCREACADDGCLSAKEAAAAVETCSQERCTTECADPKAPDCISCSQRECGPQVSACLGNRCD